MTSRQRIPTSRSNLSTARDRSARPSARGGASARSEGSSSVTTIESLTGSQIERLNDPLHVFRPFSPEIKVMDAPKVRPPVLPKSRYPTVPPAGPELRCRQRSKPLTCPPGWIEKNLAPSWFETADFATLINEDTKKQFARPFIERNRDRLWKIDLAYLHRSPREICDEMVDDGNFIGLMEEVHKRERSLNLSTSDRFASALKDNHLNSLGEVKGDPFIASIETSRETRIQRMTQSLNSAMEQNKEKRFNRGYQHTVGFGNFSQYSAVLKSNEGTQLKR